ncbi:hypothetical protein GGI21_006475 [Coemansia aciculifera]|nr:hypothetical protein GGI21_006475 [Coemansia aciculifera]
MLARQSASDRRRLPPPSSSAVTSLSLGSSSQSFRFDGGSSGLSSTNLLAGLKARSADLRSAVSAATTTGGESGRRADFRGINSQISPALLQHGRNRPAPRNDQIQRLPRGNIGGAPQSHGSGGVARSPAGVVATRPHGGVGTVVLGKSPGHRAGGDLLPMSAKDKLVVGQIRDILVEQGGEVSNAALVERFRSVFSLAELPRLNELARQVADLESRQTDPSTRRIGIGRIVQKVWKLRQSGDHTLER